MDLILTEARFSVVNRVRNGVLFSNLDGLLILISCEHGKNSHKSAQCTADYGWRDKEIKTYKKLLSACMLHSDPVQGPSSVLLLWGSWRRYLLGAASGTWGQLSSSPKTSLQPCVFSACVMTILCLPKGCDSAKSRRIYQDIEEMLKDWQLIIFSSPF